MSALFIAGAAGDEADAGIRNYAGAECWELLNMRNVSRRDQQFFRLRLTPSFDISSLNFSLEVGPANLM